MTTDMLRSDDTEQSVLDYRHELVRDEAQAHTETPWLKNPPQRVVDMEIWNWTKKNCCLHRKQINMVKHI